MSGGWGGVMGLAVGLVVGGGGLWVGMRAAARGRGVDERFRACKQLAMTQAWGVTTLLLAAALVWVDTAPSPPPVGVVIAAVYGLHLVAAATLFVVHLSRS